MNEKSNVTYRGVYFDIDKSNICSLRYGLYFYFCSEAMKKKFENNVDDFIDRIKKRINYWLPDIEMAGSDIALAIEYYIKYVEKRGFRIETLHGVKIKKGHLIGDVEFVENMEE